MLDDDEAFVAQIRRDHYEHWFALLAIAAWAASVFSWVVGLVTAVGLILLISVTNMAILAAGGSFRAVKINRWSWLAVSFGFIVFMSASIGP